MGQTCCKEEQIIETEYNRKRYFTLTKDGFYEHQTKREIKIRPERVGNIKLSC